MQTTDVLSLTRAFCARMKDASTFLVPDAPLKGRDITQIANAQFERAYMLDTAVNETFDNTGGEDLNLPMEDRVVTLSQFLISLCHPEARVQNLARIWEDHLDLMVMDGEEDRQMAVIAEVASHAEWSRAIAANRSLETASMIAQNDPLSDAGIAMTSIDFPHPYDGYATLHILKNDAGDVLMIGEGISRHIKAALKEAGITYIGRNENGAVIRAEEAVSAMLFGCKDEDIHQRLLTAFLYRNADEEQAIDNPDTLGSVMVGREYSMMYPKYICRF